MKRLREIEEESAQDSFLDVIANLVGVIIILVMLVGAKATRDVLRGTAPAEPPVAALEVPPVPTPSADKIRPKELEEARLAALKSKDKVEEIATHLVRIRQEAAEIDDERVTLAMHRSLIEEDIARRREELDSEKQKEFDVQRRIAESQMKLDQLTQQQIGLLSGPETVEELESLPTPLARGDDNDSINLRIKGGLVSIVPLQALLEEAHNHFPEIGRRLQTSSSVTETYGPIDGYRIRMKIFKVPSPHAIRGPQAGRVLRESVDYYIELLPTSEAIGQDVEQAMMPGGAIHQYLAAHRHEFPSVVVWLYGDSFADFRLLKRTLWEMGFGVATRPLSPGAKISGSPHGSDAAVQ